MKNIFLLFIFTLLLCSCNTEHNPPSGVGCSDGKYWLTKTISLSGGTTQEWPWNGGYTYDIPNCEKVRIYMWNNAGDECIEVYRRDLSFGNCKEHPYVEILDGQVTIYQ